MGYIFISYSSLDKSKVAIIVDYLEENGIDCWLYRNDLSGAYLANRKIQQVIADEKCLGVLLILSPHSASSFHVKKEIAIALQNKKAIICYPIVSAIQPGNFGEFYYENSDICLIDCSTPISQDNLDYIVDIVEQDLSTLYHFESRCEIFGQNNANIDEGSANEDDYQHWKYARILFEMGRLDEAMDHFEIAYKLNPYNYKLLIDWGDSYLTGKDKADGILYDIACKKYQAALDINPLSNEALMKWSDALMQWNIFLSIPDKLQSNNYLNCSFSLANLTFYNALNLFRKVELFKRKQLLSAAINTFEHAVEKYQEILKLEPEHDRAANNLGICLTYLGILESIEYKMIFSEANGIFKVLANKAKNNAINIFNWGSMYIEWAKKSEPTLAKSYLEKAQENFTSALLLMPELANAKNKIALSMILRARFCNEAESFYLQSQAISYLRKKGSIIETNATVANEIAPSQPNTAANAAPEMNFAPDKTQIAPYSFFPDEKKEHYACSNIEAIDLNLYEHDYLNIMGLLSKYRYLTGKQIAAFYAIEQCKNEKALNINELDCEYTGMLLDNLFHGGFISYCEFSSAYIKDETSSKIYYLDEKGKQFLLKEKKKKYNSAYNPVNEKLNVIKRQLITNQVFILHSSNQCYGSLIEEPKTNKALLNPLTRRPIITTSLSLLLEKNNVLYQRNYEIIRRKDSGWLDEFQKRIDRYQRYYELFERNEGINYQLVFLGEDYQHIIEIYEELNKREVQFREVEVFYTADCQQFPEEFPMSLLQFDDWESKKMFIMQA
ncbi:MAG: TIR domain-containing protein [Methanobacterium sp.]